MRKILCPVIAALLAVSLCAPASAAKKDDEDKETVRPVLESVALDKTLVYPGGSLLVSADAYDEGSGVKSVTAYFSAGNGGIMSADMRLKHSESEISQEFCTGLKIPRDTFPGIYKLVRVVVTDRDGNRSDYSVRRAKSDDENGRYILEQSLSFTVAEPASLPKLTACAARKVSGGIEVEVKAACAPDGMDKITLLFGNAEGTRRFILTMSADDLRDGGSYRKLLAIPKDEPAGTFTLKRAVLKDKNGGQTAYRDKPDADKDELALPFAASFTIG